MAINYLTYPVKNMRITQNYNGTVSHAPNSKGSPKDYPFDEGCSNTGRDWMYCPCDKMKVMRIYGVNGPGTNTIWLQSTSKVRFADGTSDYVTLLVTHPNDDDLSKLKLGQTFKRGDKICREGKDGTSGYHFHFSAGKGKYKANGWTQNSNGAWVLITDGSTCKPEKLFFIDPSFTKVLNDGGLKFKKLPSVECYSKYTGTSVHLDTVLSEIGVPAAYRGSWKNRVPLAKKQGITAYVGSATQNEKLINLAKQGKLKKV